MSRTAISAPNATMNYRTGFMTALIGVSMIAPIVALINFEVTNTSVYALMLTWSFLVVLGGAHVWITLAYYFDRRWLSQFLEAPTTFFVVPILLISGTTLLMLANNTAVGVTLVYGVVAINLWHHSKQNWGILALMGKCRDIDVTPMRASLVYAWPFFLASICLYLPALASLASPNLHSIALGLAGIYIVLTGLALWRARDLARRDPVVFLLAASLCLYFVPLALLNGKPYALWITFGAHSLQYYLLVFMSLSFRTRRSLSVSELVPRMAIVATVIGGATFAGYHASLNYGPPDLWDSELVRLVVGLTTGVNLVHFWLDAFIWKLSDRRSREAHGDAFSFSAIKTVGY